MRRWRDGDWMVTEQKRWLRCNFGKLKFLKGKLWFLLLYRESDFKLRCLDNKILFFRKEIWKKFVTSSASTKACKKVFKLMWVCNITLKYYVRVEYEESWNDFSESSSMSIINKDHLELDFTRHFCLCYFCEYNTSENGWYCCIMLDGNYRPSVKQLIKWNQTKKIDKKKLTGAAERSLETL